MIAIRGAICAQNNQQSIYDASAKLVSSVLHSNNIDIDSVVSIVFSTTNDIDVANPATAVRKLLGIDSVALFSTQEINVVGSLDHCIRVMILCNSNIDKKDIVHCYLDRASCLRPDLK